MMIDDYLAGVAARLDTIAGLTVTTNPLATIVPPMALVTDGTIEYDQTFGRGSDRLTIMVMVYVSLTASEKSVAEARLYKSGHGAKSIKAALETSIGVGDVIPNKTLIATSGTIGEDGRSEGSSHLVMQITATAHLPGTE
jgi:hypothetical protein